MFYRAQREKGSLETSLLKNLSGTLENLIEKNVLQTYQNSVFHSEATPQISLENYLMRIQRHARCSEECFVIAFIYLDRIQELNQELQFNKQNIHRFFISAIVLAIKFLDDDIFKNDYYAKVGGISMQELNEMEEGFLDLLDFELYVYQETYQSYLTEIKEYSRIPHDEYNNDYNM